MKTQFRYIFILIFIYNIYYSQVCNYSFGDKIDGIGSGSGVALKQIQIDANGNSIVIGRFVGSVDFDPGPVVVAYSSIGENDIFLAKYDNNGNYLWAHVFGSVGDDHGNSVSVDTNGDILITGQYSYDVDFDTGPLVYNLKGVFDRDIFICKYNSSGNFIWAKSLGSSTFETGSFIQSDQAGNVYITGFFSRLS